MRLMICRITRCQCLGGAGSVTHQPFTDRKIVRSCIRWAMIIVLVNDRVNQDGLLVDRNGRICGYGYPIVYVSHPGQGCT